MNSNKLIYFLGVFILIAFSWWFYSLFELSRSNYNSDKSLLEEHYQDLQKDFFHHAFKNEFNGEHNRIFQLSGGELKVDDSMVLAYFATNYPNDPIEIVHSNSLDSVVRFVNLEQNFASIRYKFKRKEQMWNAEGITFLIVLLMGIWFVINSNRKVIATEKQQRNFLLSVTHEFKTPIASIKLYLQTMQKRSLTKEQIDTMIVNSLKDIERLNELSENVLVATKIESSGYQYIFDRFNLSDLLENEVGKFSYANDGKYILNSDIQPDVEVSGDRFTLMLVISNLIENACKYSEPGSVVEIFLCKGETTKLKIADHGIGIHDSEKNMVFNKFYRIGNENTRRTKGTGLGLYIVKEVLKKHNAKVSIADNKPKGTIFEIEFING